MFLHYNQQNVSQSKVQKECDLTDLISAEIDSEAKDETLDVLTWVIFFYAFLTYLAEDISMIDKETHTVELATIGC